MSFANKVEVREFGSKTKAAENSFTPTTGKLSMPTAADTQFVHSQTNFTTSHFGNHDQKVSSTVEIEGPTTFSEQ